MKIFKFIIPLAAVLVSKAGFAGVVDLTMFSRANCVGVNESISWAGTSVIGTEYQFNLAIISHQTNSTLSVMRSFMEGYEQTWRLHAGCFFCGDDGWRVEGEHFADPTNNEQEDYLEQYCDSECLSEKVSNEFRRIENGLRAVTLV